MSETKAQARERTCDGCCFVQQSLSGARCLVFRNEHGKRQALAFKRDIGHQRCTACTACLDAERKAKVPATGNEKQDGQ